MSVGGYGAPRMRCRWPLDRGPDRRSRPVPADGPAGVPGAYRPVAARTTASASRWFSGPALKPHGKPKRRRVYAWPGFVRAGVRSAVRRAIASAHADPVTAPVARQVDGGLRCPCPRRGRGDPAAVGRGPCPCLVQASVRPGPAAGSCAVRHLRIRGGARHPSGTGHDCRIRHARGGLGPGRRRLPDRPPTRGRHLTGPRPWVGSRGDV
ncbi:hypothetical protein T261_00338 [Streptomyces lydicus]|nr:hypothetical protein T261_00338 [Streptomyces lydicus]